VPNARTQRILAIVSAAFVFLAPLLLARPEERLMNLVPFTLLATVPLLLVLTFPFAAIAVLVLRTRLRTWPSKTVWLIPLAVAVVGTLPGMVGVHRSFLAWHSYLDHLPFSLVSLVAISTLCVVRATLLPERLGQSASQAVIGASVVNILFPWWPLD